MFVTARLRLGLLAVGVWGLAQFAAGETLRALAERRGKFLGAFGEADYLEDPQYVRTLTQEFNVLSVGVYMHWTRPARDVFDDSQVRPIMDLAVKHDMLVRVTPVVWASDLLEPDLPWLRDIADDPKALREALVDHVTRVMTYFKTHYPGRVMAYELINEPLDNLGTQIRRNLWSRIDPANPLSYMTLALQTARKVDPSARLFVNEIFAERSDEKFGAFLGLLRRLQKDGVPIDGVGIQMHQFMPSLARWQGQPDSGEAMAVAVDPSVIRQRLASLSVLDLPVHMTEMDVPILLPIVGSSRREHRVHARRLARQASLYGGYASACRDSSRCEGILFWGVTDRYSWIPKYFAGFGAPLLFDDNYVRKAAYHSVYEAWSAFGSGPQ